MRRPPRVWRAAAQCTRKISNGSVRIGESSFWNSRFPARTVATEIYSRPTPRRMDAHEKTENTPGKLANSTTPRDGATHLRRPSSQTAPPRRVAPPCTTAPWNAQAAAHAAQCQGIPYQQYFAQMRQLSYYTPAQLPPAPAAESVSPAQFDAFRAAFEGRIAALEAQLQSAINIVIQSKQETLRALSLLQHRTDGALAPPDAHVPDAHTPYEQDSLSPRSRTPSADLSSFSQCTNTRDAADHVPLAKHIPSKSTHVPANPGPIPLCSLPTCNTPCLLRSDGQTYHSCCCAQHFKMYVTGLNEEAAARS
eukprot:gnl/Chilomastix_cuspidata/2647.p2 GENE.gnl/Chilomastix_cuspidata/2647~~gnl/Chilomastix_cuspidata/2647.p2  ORF type:complete len:308 (+),score=70.00 gnl/Chilomastix_cuspidata/2647:1482-2405(+)